MPFDQVAALAASRSFHLNSAFRPTYNMAANLVRSYTQRAGPPPAQPVVRAVPGRRRCRAHRGPARTGARRSWPSCRSERDEPVRRHRRVPPALDRRRRRAGRERRGPASTPPWPGCGPATSSTCEGHVHRAGPRCSRPPTAREACASDRHRWRPPRSSCGAATSTSRPARSAASSCPTPFAPSRQSFQRQVAAGSSRAQAAAAPEPRATAATGRGEPRSRVTTRSSTIPKLARPAQGGGAGRAGRRVRSRTCAAGCRAASRSVSTTSTGCCGILESWGYVDGWRLTDAGRRLAGIFHESDLLVVETMRQGLFDGLDPAELAGLVSVFAYEHRSPEPPPAPWFPSRDVRKRWEAIESLGRELRGVEEEAGLTPTGHPTRRSSPSPTRWASGGGFATWSRTRSSPGATSCARRSS